MSGTASRAQLLAPLMAPMASLRGVGPAVEALLARVTGGTRVLDLLFHVPESFVDRRPRPTIRGAVRGTVATLAVEVVRHEAPQTPKQPWRVVVTDGTGFAELVFFKPQRAQALVAGTKLLVSGKLESFADRLTIPHPDHIVPADQPERIPALEPVWPLTAGLFPSQVRAAMVQALARIPELPEWHDPALLRREGWPGFAEALRALHMPVEYPGPKPRARLAYDELLAHQVAMAWVRTREKTRPGRAQAGTGELRAQALRRFGHALTRSQQEALAEIDADMATPCRMLRLLQGDVGSGKTVVAALAMLRAVESGAQAALMAPTEILAQQHYRTLQALSPVPVILLTGSVKGAARRNALLAIETGRARLVVGTHALFQQGVAYQNLGLAVIDEQHRFGVDQRLSMGGKGAAADVLVMTATPIPRTLLLTQWGEMTVSRLSEKPAGRIAIRTTLHSLALFEDVVAAIARALDRGERIFWVCPLVSESEVLDVAAAEDRYITLRRRFGNRVGLAHGQQDAAVRDASLAAFARGETQLLVATTVVEVGVDVPEASVMVVDHAERFGLAQLHQLRGRVGRGAAASFCLLLHDAGLAETARRRLLLLRDTDDGFTIADEDFRIRGGGDLLGRRQSGQPGWRLADPVEHEGLLQMAHRDAAVLLSRDPQLTSSRGEAMRVLLGIFERGEAVRTLQAG
ncbi:MAG TPA: ATP-dependent DNA helicase RecG [Acetobacteraceae bacterium]|nr:ATP-dependent DNA helicase RecG [Acetobacteraceae bacterium]